MDTQEDDRLTVPEGWKDAPFTREDNPKGLLTGKVTITNAFKFKSNGK